jgi:FAD-dependent urate hydroxylase
MSRSATPTKDAAQPGRAQTNTTPADCDVAIIGAGPYGLAAAAHLTDQHGLDVRVFGRVMSFWDEQMPRGMLLRSPYVASNIASPDASLTLDGYQQANRIHLQKPVRLEDFVGYGRWFARQVCASVDTRLVDQLDTTPAGFALRLADGEQTTARRVVVACGIMPFANRPAAFDTLDAEHATHASEHADMRRFAGQRVIVVGGGQSALESAALLCEAGADVEVIVREQRIYYLRRAPIIHKLGPLTSLLFAPAEVGPAGVSRLVSAPRLYRRLPRKTQDRFAVRSLRPAGAAWLEPRLVGVPISIGRTVTAATVTNGRVELRLDDATRRDANHVLLATGYQVDVAKYAFLAPSLLGRVDRVGGYPRLSTGFETSVAGLYVIGAPSAWSYGPLMRFVAGSEFAAPTLARAITTTHAAASR